MERNALRRAAVSQAAVIVAEFFGTCLWFSATAVSPEIAASLGRPAGEPLDLSSAVQIGFVTGTCCSAPAALPTAFAPAAFLHSPRCSAPRRMQPSR
jgi:hypothetical protein